MFFQVRGRRVLRKKRVNRDNDTRCTKSYRIKTKWVREYSLFLHLNPTTFMTAYRTGNHAYQPSHAGPDAYCRLWQYQYLPRSLHDIHPPPRPASNKHSPKCVWTCHGVSNTMRRSIKVSTQQSTHLIVPVSLSFFETMTVQAPHPPSAHPNLLPVSLITSLKNERSVWFGLAWAANFSGTRSPLTKRIGVVR